MAISRTEPVTQHHYFSIQPNYTTHHEDIFTVSGTERPEVSAEYPSEDHEAGVDLHRNVLGPGDVGEAGEVHGVTGHSGGHVALDDIIAGGTLGEEEIVLGVLQVEERGLVVVSARDGDVGHAVAVEGAAEEVLLRCAGDVGEALVGVWQGETGGVSHVPVHLDVWRPTRLMYTGHHTVLPHLVVTGQSQGDVVRTNLPAHLELEPLPLLSADRDLLGVGDDHVAVPLLDTVVRLAKASLGLIALVVDGIAVGVVVSVVLLVEVVVESQVDQARTVLLLIVITYFSILYWTFCHYKIGAIDVQIVRQNY